MALPCLALFHLDVAAARAEAAPPPARVVVLGVNHAAQLVSEADRPGMLAAFVEKVSPSAVCMERAPAKYARGDHYEFTYEIQDIVLPYAHEHGLEVCPFDLVRHWPMEPVSRWLDRLRSLPPAVLDQMVLAA